MPSSTRCSGVMTSGSISVAFFFSSRRRHTRCSRDWSSDVCSSDLENGVGAGLLRVCGRCATGCGDGAERGRAGHRRGGSLSNREAAARDTAGIPSRSEERRGGEEGRSRWGPDHLKKKKEEEDVGG